MMFPPAIDAEPVGEFVLKGFRRPVAALNALALRDAAPGDGVAWPTRTMPPFPKF